MACTSCKKKKNIEVVAEVAIPEITHSSQFKLKSVLGAIQMSFGSGQFITNTVLTDELALEFLKSNPNRISMFSEYPENWKELIVEPNNVEENEGE
ncbi:MAG: hypothetical protein DI539_16110 [Flavobacterium psychrophilum]|nr:MAG: hypothetical protein DI539_16110 [Flavobacterium psychrophilum]